MLLTIFHWKTDSLYLETFGRFRKAVKVTRDWCWFIQTTEVNVYRSQRAQLDTAMFIHTAHHLPSRKSNQQLRTHNTEICVVFMSWLFRSLWKVASWHRQLFVSNNRIPASVFVVWRSKIWPTASLLPAISRGGVPNLNETTESASYKSVTWYLHFNICAYLSIVYRLCEAVVRDSNVQLLSW